MGVFSIVMMSDAGVERINVRVLRMEGRSEAVRAI